MGAERWIVFLVLASLGGGIYIMSYLVDEESIQRYGERVAEYNAQHDETMMDAALHRAKRGPVVSTGHEQPVELEGDTGSELVNNTMADHPYSENDRVMRTRIDDGEDLDAEAKRSDQSIKVEKPDHTDEETARARRSSVQGVDEGPDPLYKTVRARRSSGQGIDEKDPDDINGKTARAKRSSGQGINEEEPGRPYDYSARARKSIGQGINEAPDRAYDESARAKRSNRQGMMNKNRPNPPYHKIVKVGKPNLQDTNTAHLNSLTADLFESSEDNDGQEEQMPLSSNEFLSNHHDDTSSNEFENSDLLWKLEQSSEESYEDSNYVEPKEMHLNPEASYEMSFSGRPTDFAGLSQLPVSEDGDKKLITFNKGIDFILGLMNSMFSLEGEVSVPLPGLNKTFGHGIMRGTFEASRGFFKNPATLHRTGDVAIVKNGDSVGLEVALGLETLEAGYDHYDLKILKIHQNGTLDVSIAENSIKMKISLIYHPHCKVDVNYLELDKLGGIKVDISGLGAFQSMFDMLSKWLLDNFTNDFRNIVNKKLIEKAKKAVAREDICKYFPLNLL